MFFYRAFNADKLIEFLLALIKAVAGQIEHFDLLRRLLETLRERYVAVRLV